MIQHKLTLMRRTKTAANEFRLLLREISMLLAYEVTRDMPMEMVEIETPLAKMMAPVVAGKKLCLVSVLRAGGGILEGMLDILPAARVGHIGLYRDPVSLAAVEYYLKLPRDISERTAIVLDPMLATGNSAAAAVERGQGGRLPVDQVRLPDRRAGGPQDVPRGAPGRAGLCRGGRQPPQ